jgi:opine dehydrogenase
VIGGGNGGRAMLAYIVNKGYHVDLYNRSLDNVRAIKEEGGVWARGKLEGFYSVDKVSDNLEELAPRADIIVVVVPAFAHEEIATNLAPHLKHAQTIILNPGRTFGALLFRRILDQNWVPSDVYVGETQTLLFTSRALTGNGVEIHYIKDVIDLSCTPEDKILVVHARIHDVFPQFRPVKDLLSTTLNNIGCIFHPATTLLNASTIDRAQSLLFYKEGISPNVAEVLGNIEKEITSVGEKLGIKIMRVVDWIEQTYGVRAPTIYEAIQQVQAYKNISAPITLNTRYLLEDVPTGLVPISSVASHVGVETPTINAIIQLSGVVCGKDFWKEGRTVEKIGIRESLRKRAAAQMRKILTYEEKTEPESLFDQEN